MFTLIRNDQGVGVELARVGGGTEIVYLCGDLKHGRAIPSGESRQEANHLVVAGLNRRPGRNRVHKWVLFDAMNQKRVKLVMKAQRHLRPPPT